MAAGTSPSGSAAPGAPPRRRGLRAAVLACAVVVPVLVAAALTVGGDRHQDGPALPGRMLGLPAQRSSAARDVAAELTRRLAAEPTVSSVAVGVYGGQAETLVVLRLVPREPLTDAAASDLTARVLEAAGPGAAPDDATVTADGRASVTCATPDTAATCVSVEADAAVVVLSTGSATDPLALTQQVRDVLRAGPATTG